MLYSNRSINYQQHISSNSYSREKGENTSSIQSVTMRQLVAATWLVCLVALFGSIAAMVPVRDSARAEYGGIVQSIPDIINNLEMEALARFAVKEYNNNKNSLLEFVRVVKAAQQIVAGIMYHLTIEAKDSMSVVHLYEAKIWVKPWLNFQKLEDFKLADGN